MRCLEGHWHGKQIKGCRLSPESQSYLQLLTVLPASVLPSSIDESPVPTLIKEASQAPSDLPPTPQLLQLSHPPLPLTLGKATHLEKTGQHKPYVVIWINYIIIKNSLPPSH